MVSVRITRESKVKRSSRVMQLEGLFDLPRSTKSALTWDCRLPIEEKPWQIGLIVGPSGCGKSTLARELFGDRLTTGFDWPTDRAIVDGFPESLSIAEVTQLLSAVGFSSPPAWLRPFQVLSTGQQFRVTLARALAEPTELVVIDEFTSVVDRTVAQIGSAAVSKAIRRGTKRFVAVSCHSDIVEWLDPDWTYNPAENVFAWRLERQRPPIELELVACEPSAWAQFHPHHYLSGHLHRGSRCFAGLINGQPACFGAILAFPHNHRPGWREHRIVTLPDFQGIGLGNRFSEWLGSLFTATGKPYRGVTSSPAMIAHRRRSPLWRVIRTARQGMATQTVAAFRKTSSVDRATWSFEYIGPQVPREVAHQFRIEVP